METWRVCLHAIFVQYHDFVWFTLSPGNVCHKYCLMASRPRCLINGFCTFCICSASAPQSIIPMLLDDYKATDDCDGDKNDHEELGAPGWSFSVIWIWIWNDCKAGFRVKGKTSPEKGYLLLGIAQISSPPFPPSPQIGQLGPFSPDVKTMFCACDRKNYQWW